MGASLNWNEKEVFFKVRIKIFWQVIFTLNTKFFKGRHFWLLVDNPAVQRKLAADPYQDFYTPCPCHVDD